MRVAPAVLVFFVVGVLVVGTVGPGHADEKVTGWLKVARGTRVRLTVEDGGPCARLSDGCSAPMPPR